MIRRMSSVGFLVEISAKSIVDALEAVTRYVRDELQDGTQVLVNVSFHSDVNHYTFLLLVEDCGSDEETEQEDSQLKRIEAMLADHQQAHAADIESVARSVLAMLAPSTGHQPRHGHL